LLVKTAFFGNDPNWGRIACAAGYAGVSFDVNRLSVAIGDRTLLENGTPTGVPGPELQTIMNNPEYTVKVSIGTGSGRWRCLTSDISYEYVKNQCGI
jgi:glutamate N-acetyltransferase/amino-acid N-acetyltransferase